MLSIINFNINQLKYNIYISYNLFINYIINIKIYNRIITIEYNKNLNAYISLIYYGNGEKRYFIYLKDFIIGNTIINNSIQIGNFLPLTYIPLGTIIHNIEIKIFKGSQLSRVYNSKSKLISKEKKWVILKLPSGKIKLIYKKCLSIINKQENKKNNKIKSMYKYYLIKNKKIRGLAMNSIDHPHGGGEGKSPIGRKKPTTPWGYPALGKKYKKKNKYKNKFY
uniref:Ribosomal protein L2 n=1 Tax=Ombrophytum subterraneum TaxID=50155 RepID=A0A8E7MJN4_9MAGN|nr:ribosomal protein L2 [Ombrophytum subterraneum]